MVVTADDVADVVQVSGDRREFLLVMVVVEAAQHIASDASDQIRVSRAMFGETEHAEISVGRLDVGDDFRIACQIINGDGECARTWLGGGFRLVGMSYAQVLHELVGAGSSVIHAKNPLRVCVPAHYRAEDSEIYAAGIDRLGRLECFVRAPAFL